MKKKISEKRAPIGIEDPAMAYAVQQIYDDLNELISAVNVSGDEDANLSDGKEGDIRVISDGKGDYRIEIYSEDGWYVSKNNTFIPAKAPRGTNITIINKINVSNFKNSWVNYGKAVESVSFYKDGDRVYLQGAIKSGTPGAQSVIFTLPDGYVPEKTVVFPCIVSGTELGRIHVRNNGDVVMFSDDSTSKATIFTALDGINFKVQE